MTRLGTRNPYVKDKNKMFPLHQNKSTGRGGGIFFFHLHLKLVHLSFLNAMFDAPTGSIPFEHWDTDHEPIWIDLQECF